MTKPFDIHLVGVGGQGIGLLSETLLRAADHAGLPVKGVDTHGLAQRGGVVISRIRIGRTVYTPLIRAGRADLAAALERCEALRAVVTALRPGGTLIYYDTEWQPLDVRLGRADQVTHEDVAAACESRDVRLFRVVQPDLPDARMQNMALLARLIKNRLVPGVAVEHIHAAMDDLMTGSMLSKNREVFDTAVAA